MLFYKPWKRKFLNNYYPLPLNGGKLLCKAMLCIGERGGFSTALPANVVAPEELVEITDFAKIKLKTAKVLTAERVEGADKLLKLSIEVGSEKRPLVAGVAQYYTPEEMVGKTIVIVANLKPAVIRGVESAGMLLAAKSGKKLALVTVEGDIPSGANIG